MTTFFIAASSDCCLSCNSCRYYNDFLSLSSFVPSYSFIVVEKFFKNDNKDNKDNFFHRC